VPVGVAVLTSLPFVLPADPPRIRSGGLDVGGALLVTSSVALLVYGLTTAGDEGWGSPATLVPLGAAALLGTAFVALERRLSSPLIRVELLTRRPVVAGTVVMLAASALLLSMFFLASLYLQHVMGYDALETGLAFVPAAVAVTLGAHAAARVIGHVGARPVAVVAFVLAAVGAGLLTQLSADSGLWTGLVPGLVVTALGLGPGFVVATSTALSHVDAGEAGLASGIVNTGHELGGALGVAVISTVAAGSLAVGAVDTGGFTDAFTVMAGVGAAVALAAWFLVPAGRTTTVGVGHGHAH
jgi:hypothetical protein